MDSKTMADLIYAAIDDRKGKKIEVIDTHEMTTIADYFIIAGGTSTTHVRGIADAVEEKLLKEGIRCSHIEGYDTATWILLDYLDVVVHLFIEEDREYYNLERLWKNGARPEK
ncbi:MAG: ribosome silencing factor [Ruminococcaceae bacterium]|nr:ribosome silencing factor [Oscillospiraceae bacterium]